MTHDPKVFAGMVRLLGPIEALLKETEMPARLRLINVPVDRGVHWTHETAKILLKDLKECAPAFPHSAWVVHHQHQFMYGGRGDFDEQGDRKIERVEYWMEFRHYVYQMDQSYTSARVAIFEKAYANGVIGLEFEQHSRAWFEARA